MRRLGTSGMALVVMFVMGGYTSTAAFGLPEHLPKGTWTARNDGTGVPTVETAKETKLQCSKAVSTGKDTTDTLGEFAMTFEGCENPATKIKCNSLGDPAGLVLMSGEYHSVYDTLSPLGVAILFLPKELHIECSALVLLLLKSQTANGGLLCLILEPTSSKLTHLFHCEQAKGVQSEKKYWNDAAAEITKVELLCSTNGGAFEMCALLMLFEWTYAESGLWENV